MFLACRPAVPVMRAQGRGAIGNVSSLAVERINAYPYLAYYASKAGLNHLTRALAVQYAPDGIRANAVMPGVMDTPLIHGQIAGQYADREAMMQARRAMSPMGRMGRRVGRGTGGAVPGVRRCGLHHGRVPAGRWRAVLHIPIGTRHSRIVFSNPGTIQLHGKAMIELTHFYRSFRKLILVNFPLSSNVTEECQYGIKDVQHANATSVEGYNRASKRIPLGDSVLLLSGLAVLSWIVPVGGLWLVWRVFM